MNSNTASKLFIFLVILQYSYFVASLNNFNNIRLSNDNIKNYKINGFKLMSSILLTSILSFSIVDNAAMAADTKLPLLIYKSGKNSVAPNNNDPKLGTKKEPAFLRCVSNCKSDCQKPGEGLAKNDCVSDCQDQCCASYEQCSFKIKSTSGNQI